MFSMCGSMGGCPWSTCVIGLTGQRVGEGKGGGEEEDMMELGEGLLKEVQETLELGSRDGWT